MSIVLQRCIISQNFDSGLMCLDFWKGALLLMDTKIEDNLKDGLFLWQDEFPKAASV
jgi:hypothetical protein